MTPPPKAVRRRRSGVSGPYAEESALLAIRAGCSRDLGDLKQLAEGKIRRVGQRLLCTHAEHLALSLGYTVTREAPGGPCGCEGLVPNELFVQRARPLMFALRVLHELAHALLRDTTYTHGDVWVLTIFLAIPAAALPHLERSKQLTPPAPGPASRPRGGHGGHGARHRGAPSVA